MPKNVQIRNVDDATYEVLRQRAAEKDLSLAQYLRRELVRLAEPRQQTMAEWLDRVDRSRHLYSGVTGKDVEAAFDEARAERDARFDDL